MCLGQDLGYKSRNNTSSVNTSWVILKNLTTHWDQDLQITSPNEVVWGYSILPVRLHLSLCLSVHDWLSFVFRSRSWILQVWNNDPWHKIKAGINFGGSYCPIFSFQCYACYLFLFVLVHFYRPTLKKNGGYSRHIVFRPCARSHSGK